ncbi:hypothetical protein HU730_018295 [Pseudomonas sp. SWRI22]|uniref:hypothetical protein n=1 Tax=Pseudomonas sp. SWRI22 TaxID=2745513 RepID=UPI001644ABD4|nr:hypothetical protein [Pseudomonas sp. SWRI22]MBV4511999.1 hypothetical protein [Pseudomonas sp. SWRI22]
MKKSKEKSKKLKKTEKILRKEIKTNNQRPEVRSYRQNQQKRTYRLDERAEGARENISDGQKKPENLTCVRLSGFLNTLDWIPVGYVQDDQKGRPKRGPNDQKGDRFIYHHPTSAALALGAQYERLQSSQLLQ